MAGIQITVQHDLQSMVARLQLQARQLPFVTSRAINGAGLDAKKAVEQEIPRAIDRPTSYTRNALFFRYSTKTKLQASVRIKDVLPSGSRMTTEQRIGHLFVKGGVRNFTGFEGWLLQAGYLKSGEYIVPTTHAKRDAYGNVSRGLLVQILSQLKAGPDRYQNKSNSARSRKSRKKQRIFWSTGDGGMKAFSRGIWAETPAGLVKLMAPAARPSYRVLVDMERIIPRVVEQRFPWHFEDEAIRAMR